jgi:hypothetical protein
MRVSIAVAAALTFAAPLLAQNTTATAPAPVTPVATAKFSVDTPIETIAADPAAKVVLDAAVPGLTTHAMYEQFKTMSLKQLQPMSGGRITDDGLVKAGAALATVK